MIKNAIDWLSRPSRRWRVEATLLAVIGGSMYTWRGMGVTRLASRSLMLARGSMRSNWVGATPNSGQVGRGRRRPWRMCDAVGNLAAEVIGSPGPRRVVAAAPSARQRLRREASATLSVAGDMLSDKGGAEVICDTPPRARARLTTREFRKCYSEHLIFSELNTPRCVFSSTGRSQVHQVSPDPGDDSGIGMPGRRTWSVP